MPTPHPVLALTQHFARVRDPRVERTKLHLLIDIVTITICAVIAGAETWEEIAQFGEAKAAWFATFLALPHGIPSHDTFNRVFAALNPLHFRQCFLDWMQAVAEVLPAQVIALDGKTVCGSSDLPTGKGAIHMVSAWATANRMVLAQVKVADKSNEITALPVLLQALAVTGCIVTIDAMGCQRDIAAQLVAQGATYILALKENQPSLYEEVVDLFTEARRTHFAQVEHTTHRQVNKGHGRLEIRRHWVITDAEHLAWLQEAQQWPGLRAIGLVEAERRIGEQVTCEVRYYLLSAPLTAQELGQAVRSHWGIENQVHGVLDVVFGEDHSRIRAGYAAENFVVVRHIALNLLHQHQGKKGVSLKAKRLRAGWDTVFLLQILSAF